AHSVRSEGGWLAAGWVLGRPGADRPSPWPRSAPGRPTQPAFSRCIGLAVRGREAPVGHGFKNVKGQGTVTTPWRHRPWSGERLPQDPQHRNGNHRPRVLLDKPAHTGVGERLVEA